MLGSRAVRDTIRRIKKSEGRGGWGPKSGVNDAPKLLASVALFVGCRVGCLLLETWLSDGPDPVLRTILDTAAALAGLRVLFYTIRRPLMRALLRGPPEPPPGGAPVREGAGPAREGRGVEPPARVAGARVRRGRRRGVQF